MGRYSKKIQEKEKNQTKRPEKKILKNSKKINILIVIKKEIGFVNPQGKFRKKKKKQKRRRNFEDKLRKEIVKIPGVIFDEDLNKEKKTNRCKRIYIKTKRMHFVFDEINGNKSKKKKKKS